MKLIIGNKNYSSWSLRPWLLMRVKGIEFSEQLIPLAEADSKTRRLQVSPAAKVPVLLDGAITIWDSMAIAETLAEKFPQLQLWPVDASARVLARCVTAEMHSSFESLRKHMPMNLRGSHPGQGQTPEVLADIARIVELWSDCRSRYGASGEFLFGEFGIADAFYAPVVTRFLTYGVPLPEVCSRYVAAIRALPAMQQWYAAGLAESARIAASEPYS